MADVAAVGRILAVPKILELVTRTTGMRFAAIARVTESRWIACAVRDEIAFGLVPGGELELRSTICNEIRQHHQPVVFGHASEHPHFSTHHTPKTYGLQSYVSVPIFRESGEFFGTLCAIDTRPAELDDPNIVKTLELFAELIGAQIDIEEMLELSQSSLSTAQDVAAVRERVVAELARDLHQPIQAVVMETYLVKTSPGLDENIRRGMAAIENHVWDISTRLGSLREPGHRRIADGNPPVPTSADAVTRAFDRVLSDVAAAHPARAIAANIAVDHVVECDVGRLGELLNHLLLHAFEHGDAERPVSIEAATSADALTVGIICRGKPIAPGSLSALSAPRGSASREDMGMGLFIASEIAHAHGGRIEAAASSDAIRLTFTMPLVATSGAG